MTLGENIVRLRKGKGLSQGDLADALEVSRQSVSKWETDASVPELEKLVKLSELFEISLDELVRGEKETVSSSVMEPSRQEKTGSPYKTAAIVLLCMAFAVLLVFTALGSFLEGLVFCLPFALCGLICLLSRRRAGLRCAWAVWVMVDLFLRFATSIHWSLIRMTFSYDPSWNYFRLATAWVQFICMIALVVVTIWCLRKENLELTKKNVVRTAVVWGVFLTVRLAGHLLNKLMYQVAVGNLGLLDPIYDVYYTLTVLLQPVELMLLTAGLSMTLRLLKSRKAARREQLS